MAKEESISQAIIATSTAALDDAGMEQPIQTELMIQYGQLHRDVNNLSAAVRKLNPGYAENYVMLLVLTATPMLLLQVSSDLLLVIARPTLLAFMHSLFGLSAIDTSGETFLRFYHFVVLAVGMPLCFWLTTFFSFYRLNFFAAGGPFKPTHIGIMRSGIRFHWRNSCTFSSDVVPWDDIADLQLVSKDKRGRACNRVMLRTLSGSSVDIDLDLLRTDRERAVLGNALRAYLPNGALSREKSLQLETALPQFRRYTQIWTQALLTAPTRVRLGLLPVQTKLHRGKYTILKLLGSGGQGSAYLASTGGKSALPERVVLKEYVLPDQNNLKDRRRALKKLETEVHVLGSLDHPQIVSFYDMFIEDHRAYLAFEFIDGASLRTQVKEEGPLDQRFVQTIGLEMCRVLDYLHALNPPLVHQDFTPDNLLLSADGTLKLVDFNVARDVLSTRTASIVGKQAYMSPEQFKGMITPSSDIYALGATLFFLLTGFDPEPLSPARVSDFVPSVSAQLNDLIFKATSFDPALRFVSAGSLSSALKACRLDNASGPEIPTRH